jgi:hypothetical protein
VFHFVPRSFSSAGEDRVRTKHKHGERSRFLERHTLICKLL